MLASKTSLQCRAPVARRAATLAPSRPARVQLRAATETEAKSETKSKKKVEEEFSDGPDFGPTTAQVQSFLNQLCDETNVAQVELKLGSFSMKVVRSLEGAAAAAAAPAPAAAAPLAPAPVVVLTGGGGGGSPAEESIDEALVYVTAPKVGIFRRGKYAAGKRVGKDTLVKDGDTMRNGQTVAFVEQLGTFVEIKTAQGGEIVKFRVNEGEPVEYGQVVCDIAPQFGFISPAS
ncbi:MAG: acetyl-CoA biotin carboxyl carrier [Monoraphidium minutum]|nr:MAG: acetyl-CoA biotin carboxyl carrier [Monoraphidium minutum]